jgi:uncharacterized iron-regulated membrane protein
MSEKSASYRVRRIHRYLGLFIGVQFVLWTVGGLYFSWTDLDEVHGDHLMAPQPHLRADAPLASPTMVLDAIRAAEPVDSLAGVELVGVLGAPVYRVRYFTRSPSGPVRRTRLADAVTGRLRPEVSREEALRIARHAFAGESPVRSVEYLTPEDIGRHHEYRAQPLPAWAVTFEHPSSATAYVPAEVGAVHRIRHEKWRIFDFLWMLHTMDYRGRDDFNNLLLRAFSVLGLVTVLSGFVLFALTSSPYRTRIRARAARKARKPPR